MRPHRIVLAAFAAVLLTTSVTAERAPEDRDDATHVVVGTVDGVYGREVKGHTHYVVEVVVEKVTKGEGLVPGDVVYAHCYRRNGAYFAKLPEAERKRALLSFSNYSGVPAAGERVRVYVVRRGGKFTGVYPDWYDRAEKK